MVTQSGGVLVELLARIAVAGGGVVEVPGNELAGWPQDDVAALKSYAVLLPGKPAESAICPGCELACGMPVQVLPRTGRPASLFIVCDKPVDINRVAVSPAALEQWQVSVQSLADAISRLLGGTTATAHGGNATDYRLGFVQGKQDRAVLHLSLDNKRPRLLVAGHALEVEDVLVLREQRLALDQRLLARCVNAPAAGASAVPPESQEAVGKRMLARKLALKAAGTKPFVKVIALEEGCSESWVKQLIAKASAPNPFAGLGMRPAPDTAVSTRKKRPR